jgi:hypothetical protein
MPMIPTCSAPGCRTRTLGEFCLEHEPLPAGEEVTRPARTRPPARPALPGEKAPPEPAPLSSVTELY